MPNPSAPRPLWNRSRYQIAMKNPPEWAGAYLLAGSRIYNRTRTLYSDIHTPGTTLPRYSVSGSQNTMYRLEDHFHAGPYADQIVQADHIVWSNGVPIAWHHHPNGGWVMPAIVYDAAIARHQYYIRRALHLTQATLEQAEALTAFRLQPLYGPGYQWQGSFRQYDDGEWDCPVPAPRLHGSEYCCTLRTGHTGLHEGWDYQGEETGHPDRAWTDEDTFVYYNGRWRT